MKSITVRFSDELMAILKEKAERSGSTLSDVIRISLTEKTEDSGIENYRVSELEAQIKRLSETVERLTAIIERSTRKSDSDQANLRENISRLIDILAEEKKTPFGLKREFVQAAIIFCYALSKGSFSNNPEQWKPIIDDAKTRANRKEGE